MAVFPLLQDPAGYRPCADNMLVDIPYRDYWLAHFVSHFEIIVRLAIENYGEGFAGRAHACRDELAREMHQLKENPRAWGELNLLVLDMIRQQKLRAFDIPDPFEKMKARENASMLELYPRIVAEVDGHATEERRLLALVDGIFAGNIFDLGAGATAARFATERVDFVQVRDSISRPWLIDDYDAFAGRVLHGPAYRKAVFFCDNAGSDCVLGVLPFVRWLARRGTTVILTANWLPALNDITHGELIVLAQQVAALDGVFADLLERGRIRIINSGGVAPLIDLRHVSDAVCAEAADADLVVLEGMGRGLESNFDAKFKVDVVKLCMIKEQIVADRHGGKLFDTVFRYEPAKG